MSTAPLSHDGADPTPVLSLVRSQGRVKLSADEDEVMTAMAPFLAGPPTDRSRPWRVVADGSQSNGMALGDARIAPGAPGPGRHVHTHEDEGIYVVAGILTVEVGTERYEVGAESFV